MKPPPPKPDKPADPKALREARLAQALRGNLKRRKAAAAPQPTEMDEPESLD